jgi:hypothetical protein
MAQYDGLEREIIDHFKREYLQSAKETADEDIYRLMVEHKYGKGARDPMTPVDWDRVFGENQCPACGDTLSLGEKEYVCGKCRFSVPLELYDKAAKQHRNRMQLIDEEKTVNERILAAKVSEHRLDLLYEAAVDEALKDLEGEEMLAESREPGAAGRIGAPIRKGPGGGT